MYKNRRFNADLMDVKSSQDWIFGTLLFMLPLSYLWQLQAAGTIVVFELVAALAGGVLFFLILNCKEEPLLKRIMWLSMIWIGFQVVTDMYRNSDLQDYLRGWARIIFFITNTAVLWRIIDHRAERVHWFAAGVAFSGLVSALMYNGFLIDAYTWKMGWMVPFTYGLIWFACRIPAALAPLALLASSGVSLFMQGRSLAGICFAAGLYLAISEILKKKSAIITKWGWKLKLGIGVGALLSLVVAVAAFSYVARLGYLGEELKEKSDMQLGRADRYLNKSAWSPLVAPIIGGRTEMIVSTQAIADAPILGHGSWAKDFKYIELMATMAGITFEQIRAESPEAASFGLIPTHSHFFGAWVDGGLGGAIFWGFVWVACINGLFQLFVLNIPGKPLLAFVLINSLWDILFSPFDTGRRLLMAFVIVGIVVIHRQFTAQKQAGLQAVLANREFQRAVRAPKVVAHEN
jgi:hypothetical protein